MNTRTLSNHGLSVIDQYQNFRVGSAFCSVPYFNNKTAKIRAGLRALIGKGSPEDIFEEVKTILVKNHVDQNALQNDGLKKILTDFNIGIECSGFAYYVLNAESKDHNLGSLDKHIHFVNCRGLLAKMRCSFRPVENCNVATLANDANSHVVPINQIEPGDFISMQNGPEGDERDHILVIHQVDYQNFSANIIHYVHAVAYPEDGIYGTGIRQGTIEIVNPDAPLSEAIWTENQKSNADNNLWVRASRSITEVRRLNWFH